MRNYEYRAKCEDGFWVYGSLVHVGETIIGEEDVVECDIWQIVTNDGVAFNIDKNTIGEFTGKYDKDKEKIYEGDIIEIDTKYFSLIVYIEYCEAYGQFVIRANTVVDDIEPFDMLDHVYKKLGNIYDNPDILKKMEELN